MRRREGRRKKEEIVAKERRKKEEIVAKEREKER